MYGGLCAVEYPYCPYCFCTWYGAAHELQVARYWYTDGERDEFAGVV